MRGLLPAQRRDKAMDISNCLFHDAFDSAAIGLLIVRADLSIVFANSYLYKEFGFLPQPDKYKACKLFSDTVSDGACFLCGQTLHCRNCSIRKGLDKMIRDGTVLKNAVISHTSFLGTRKQVKWYLVHGSRFFSNNEIYATLTFVDFTLYKDQEQRLLQRLDLDLSTNTLNKHSLLVKIDALLSGGDRRHFAICMMDFDGFKEINDRHGHVKGDEILRIFSGISRRNIRANDMIGRYGGEEFIFIFPDTGLEDAVKVILRIQKDLKEHCASLLPYPVSFSAGMLYIDKKACKALTGTELIDQVDKLLYRAKMHGKNRLVTIKQEYPFY